MVAKPGLLTTIQDLGRPKARSFGVTTGGAMDRFALIAGNLLVGNRPGAAALEITLIGPALVARAELTVAVTGGDLRPTINGQEVPVWTAMRLRAGDVLSFAGRRRGIRAYLCVAGGFCGDRWLNSMSTDLLVGRGGFEGRSLSANDVLQVNTENVRVADGRQLDRRLRPEYPLGGPAILHTVTGPHTGWLSTTSAAEFLRQQFTVSPASNRMGYRLQGEPLSVLGPEIMSFGLVAGCVQLPRGGQPILLMADHQTAGGYPVIGCVARADLPIAAQLAPGESLLFAKISPSAAQRQWRTMMQGLESIAGS